MARLFHHSFAGGEIAPEMFGRIDAAQYRAGASRVRNFLPKPHGPLVRRPGTRWVDTAKDSAQPVMLIPFTYSTTETVVLAFNRATVDSRSIGNIRFYRDGEPITYSTPADYVAPATFSTTTSGSYTNGVDTAGNSILCTGAHALTVGNPIVFTLSGTATLPAPLVAGTTYYAIIVDSDEIKVATTAALAAAGTAIDLTTGGTGSSGERKIHYAYTQGDLVRWTGGDPGNFYCMSSPHATHAGYLPTNTDVWYREPADMIYECPHGYASADLFNVHYVQSNDVLTMVHGGYNAAEVRRYGDTRWTAVTITIGAAVSAPTTVSASATRGEAMEVRYIQAGNPVQFEFYGNHTFVDNDTVYVSGVTGGSSTVPDGYYSIIKGSGRKTVALADADTGRDFDAGGGPYTPTTAGTGYVQLAALNDDALNYYVVTAVDALGVESTASSAASVTNNLFVNGGQNTITWSAVTGASRYRVYKRRSGLYGLIGEGDSTATSFVDDNIAPDLGQTPPILDTSMSGPRAVTYFEGRRCFAGTNSYPQSVWMTRSNTESDLSYSLPIKDNDRIRFTVASREANTIRHLVPLSHLIILTSGSEYRVTSLDGAPLTPGNVTPRPQSYVGASEVQPAVVGTSIVFAAARGGHVRELGFSSDAGGYITGDLSLRAHHLFDGLSIVQMAYQKAPFPVVWFVSNDGSLLSLTYAPEEQLGAWARHTTDGAIESVAVVAEGNEDRVYVVVRRTVNGSSVRFVERMDAIGYGDAEDAFFVDCGVTATPSGLTVSGLTHLVGETVSVLVDGEVQDQKVVSASGTITLDATGDVAQVGLPFTSTMRTLPVALQIEGYGQGKPKTVNRAKVRYGEDAGEFEVAQVDADGVVGDYAPSASLDDGGVLLPGGWSPDGSIEVRVTDPTPMTIISLTTEVVLG